MSFFVSGDFHEAELWKRVYHTLRKPNRFIMVTTTKEPAAKRQCREKKASTPETTNGRRVIETSISSEQVSRVAAAACRIPPAPSSSGNDEAESLKPDSKEKDDKLRNDVVSALLSLPGSALVGDHDAKPSKKRPVEHDEESSSALAVRKESSTDTISLLTLNHDCLNAMLSFLSLRGCLKFASLSKTSMAQIYSDIHRRRLKMKTPSVYRVLPELHQYQMMPASNRDTEQDWQDLPTIRDRIEWLLLAIPHAHHLRSRVRALLDAIDEPDDTNDNAPNNNVGEAAPSFQELLARHSTLTRAHRLHATVLTDAVFANPTNCDEHGRPTPEEMPAINQRFLTTTMDTYIGHVLVACYLMGNSISGLVEGSITETQWVARFSWVTTNLGVQYALNWYHAWIFLHSTMLRVAPFTTRQRGQLGIGLPLGLLSQEQFDSSQVSKPHIPFFTQSGVGNLARVILLFDALYSRTMQGLHCTCNFVRRDSWQLDLVQYQMMTPASCMKVIGDTMLHPTFYQDSLDKFQAFWQTRRNGTQDLMLIETLIVLHGEARKVRTLTTGATLPLITISCPPLDPDM